uniref:AAA family ATPase n=1 Tax=Vaginimicrobium propionicum TaxID=1871034 RepID=UPI000970DD8E|nr:AAA family ATPase [Vaginimicrobium propionicum]
MRLHRLELHNVKGIEHQVVDFADQSVTVISGANETGKSTLVEAFTRLLDTKYTSNAKTIKVLRPKTRDAVPKVSAEFTIGTDRVEVVKEFSGSASAKMTLKYVSGSKRGNSLTAGEAEDELQALLAHTDQALWSALNEFSTDPFKQMPLTSSNALTAALRKAAGLASSNNDTSVITQAKRERDKFFTAQKGNPTGDYARLINDLNQSKNQLDLARKRIKEIEETENNLSKEQSRATQLSQDLAQAKEHLAKVNENQAQIIQAQQKADEAQAQVTQVHTAQRLCQSEYDQRQGLIKDEEHIRNELDEIEKQIKDLKSQLAQAKSELEKAETRVKDANKHQNNCEEAWNLAATCSQFLRLKTELAKAENQLKDHAANRSQLTKIEASLESEPIKKGVGEYLVAEIVQASGELKAAEAALKAASTKLRIKRLGKAKELIIDGEAMQITESSDVEITGESTVVVPDSWQFNFVVGESLQYREKVSQARLRYQEALAAAGAESLEQAQKRLNAVTKATYEADAIRKQLTSIDADELTTRVRDLREQISDLATQCQPSVSLTEAIEEEKLAKTKLDSARQLCLSAVEKHKKLDEHRQTIVSELSRLLGIQDGKTGQAELVAKQLASARETVPDQKLTDDLDQANLNLAKAQEIKAAADKKLAALDVEECQQNLKSCEQAVISTEKNLKECHEAVNTLKGQLIGLRAKSCQQDLDEAETKYQSLELAHERITIKAKAARLLYETLAANLAKAQSAYQLPFGAAINKLGARVYDDPDFAVRLADDLTITARTLGGLEINFEQLSAGAKEQLLILAKLAAAMLVDTDDGVPVFLDDELGHTDPDRAREIASEIGKAGQGTQLIILTSNAGRYAELTNRKDIKIS